jgi:hypothetical protein
LIGYHEVHLTIRRASAALSRRANAFGRGIQLPGV